MSEDESSKKLWSGMRVWYPPNDPQGAYYLTKFVDKVEKDGVTTVIMELIPEKSDEGELQKRLTEKIDDNLYRLTLMGLTHDFTTSKEIVTEILEKAEKEFPMRKDAIEIIPEAKKEIVGWEILIEEYWVKLILKWFNKWFGEKECSTKL